MEANALIELITRLDQLRLEVIMIVICTLMQRLIKSFILFNLYVCNKAVDKRMKANELIESIPRFNEFRLVDIMIVISDAKLDKDVYLI